MRRYNTVPQGKLIHELGGGIIFTMSFKIWECIIPLQILRFNETKGLFPSFSLLYPNKTLIV